MNPNVLIAAIAAGGTIAAAMTALLLNNRGFNSLERRLEVIETDLKEFFRKLTRHETDIARLKDKARLS